MISEALASSRSFCFTGLPVLNHGAAAASSSSSPASCSSKNRPPLALRASAGGTLYDVLELSPDVGLSDIKQAYRQMARKYHPDVCSQSEEESTRRFIEIQEAYETLCDPWRRAMYDRAVAMGMSNVSAAAAGGRVPWKAAEREFHPADWRSQWEGQLSELKRRSSMKARRTDSWSARVWRENGATPCS